MESRRLVITSSALAHGRLNVRACGREFFPADAFGKPSISQGGGVPIRILAIGLPDPIETDLPTDNAGRPRWFLRSRGWVKEFVRKHDLAAGDQVLITRPFGANFDDCY